MDYYKILNLNINSSKESIDETFRVFSNNYKPENANSKEYIENFKKVFEAKYFLSDKIRREKYDVFYKELKLDSEGFNYWRVIELKKLTEEKELSKWEIALGLAGEILGGLV